MRTPLSHDRIKQVLADPYTELQLPVGSPPDQIAAVFRTICLQATLNAQPNANHDPDAFQRQAVAYRFLNSLPIASKKLYCPDEIFAKLRPVDAHSGDESNERASPMLEVAIATMEQSQRTWELPYTNYVITVHYCLRKHVVRRRYKEFQALHEILEKKLPVIPTLPPRSWLYKLKMASERAYALAQYLTRVIEMLANRGLFSMDIMAFLEIPFTRIRAEEEALAIDYLSRLGSSNVYYIIHAGWLHSWKRFVSNATFPPAKITNDHLLQSDTARDQPKGNLSAARHYRCVNAQLWQYLVAIYGGGPRILRKTPSIYGASVYDMTTLAIYLQKIVRGFLGRVQAKKRRQYMLRQDPVMEKRLYAAERKQQLQSHMDTVRKFVVTKEYQIRHVAAIKIQRRFRAFLLRLEHKLLMHESAVPTVAENFQHIEEYFSLEEIGLIKDPKWRLAHFLVTMNKGVPIQKLRQRLHKKQPKWRMFKINQIGSQLIYSSKKRTRTVAFANCTSIAMESPLVVKNPMMASLVGGAAGRKHTVYEHTVVLKYHPTERHYPSETKPQDDDDYKKTGSHELILICESHCDCEALYFGLDALIKETQSRISQGASYVDGHGIIRKKVPHAKRLLRDATELLAQGRLVVR